MTRLQLPNPATHISIEFPSSAEPSPSRRRHLDESLEEVARTIAAVWPLADYVAVNPYMGLTDRSFLDARSYLKTFSDCETLMPLGYFADQFRQGQFGVTDIEQAQEELADTLAQEVCELPARSIVDLLQANDGVAESPQDRPVGSPRMRTIAEFLDRDSDVCWTEVIRDEITKYCAAHYDEGEAAWSSPWRGLPLYQAWRSAAQHDLNATAIGMDGFRQLVKELPHSADAAIVQLLSWLNVPEELWSRFLLCQATSIAGWTAWANYKSKWSSQQEASHDDLAGLLAMRLAYDVALSSQFAFDVDWTSVARCHLQRQTVRPGSDPANDSAVRYLLLRASEIGYRNRLLHLIDSEVTSQRNSAAEVATQGHRKLAQMVFCIDVRSERIRRNLEVESPEIETLGFAGFFGMPISYVALGEHDGRSHLPVLLKPEIELHEGLRNSTTGCEVEATRARRLKRSWRSIWKSLQSSAIGCFYFVESTGLLYGLRMLGRSLKLHPRSDDYRFDGVPDSEQGKLGPTLRGLNQQGFTTTAQCDLAESVLGNLGLKSDFARLVVFCGHTSQTENNPLAASLDCGACGGHSGEPNARMAATLLNQSYVREGLKRRGITIPDETHFVSAIHNTTTDEITYFDLDEVPDTHDGDIRELVGYCDAASQRTQRERWTVDFDNSNALPAERAIDWSEVRPEWGLAGNASMVIGPRQLTSMANLEATTFLHSYDQDTDHDGSVLETIMTAPMVVANWINLQYYASTVDNRHFGSGNKTVHNVVGQFGILSGNGGDLQTGLPWQSLHTGDRYQHLPLRLQVVIAASRQAIDNVLEKHSEIADLVNNEWLYLIAIDDGVYYRYGGHGTWHSLAARTAHGLQIA